LAALAAAAAAEFAGAASATAITAAHAGVVASAATNVVAPVGAASVTGLAVTLLEAVAAIVGATILVGAAPLDLAGAGVGGSSRAAAAKVRRPRRSPLRQWLSYVSEHRFTTFMVHLRAGCEARLPLPTSFVGTMGRNPPTSIMVEEGSGGQTLYLVEILHDEQGKSYLADGWMSFLDDYDLKCGWSLICTRRAELPVLCLRIVDTSGCARAYSPWP
jgi:hypothetical protein